MKFRLTAALGLSAALLLTACATNEQPTTPNASTPDTATSGTTTPGGDTSSPAGDTQTPEPPAPALKGTLTGIGASSMGGAQTSWIAAFQTANPDVTINYSPDGSGAGREAFQKGGADFAGSDRAFKPEENAAATLAASKCAPGTTALDLPVYVSPIAVIFKVDGVTELNLTPDVLAAIFKGDIKKWNDPKITALNSGATLPDLQITAVHRSDKSGTTGNFTDYLNKAAASVWTDKSTEEWDAKLGGEGAAKSQGMLDTVKNGVGTIGYVDMSYAAGMTIAKIGKEGAFAGPTAEEAATAIDASPLETGRAAGDIAINIDRTASGYPIVLISYAIACQQYKDAATGTLVKAYLTSMASEAGQKLSAEKAGSAPLSATLREKVLAAIATIK